MVLFERIIEETRAWRVAGYPCNQYPVIKEILEFNRNVDGQLRFLRLPQFEALEVYWYVRLKLYTPKFLELYNALYSKKKELYNALGFDTRNHAITDEIIEGDLIQKITSDTEFVRNNHLESIHESINLAYPSYILALTMGAGKTLLISAIITTEFAMSLEYGNDRFMKNALVFAPDKTIIHSLKEIADTPFDRILPSKHYSIFMANYKLIYTQDGAKNIDGLIDRSSYNIIVTNTHKIIPRKISSAPLGELERHDKNEQATLTANLRLKRLASLPAIGIFSDEAHHTYGQKIGEDLKRVREAINYIGNATDIICVVNTTGTPYYKKQTLKDVIFWYGLEQGIKDNILKSLESSIVTYNFKNQSEEEVMSDVIRDFFTNYGSHTLPNGAKAKIAFYFKSSEHLDECRTYIEKALTLIGQPTTCIIKNTETSSKSEIEEFHSLNDPRNEKRVILLIQKGTEGWNCPSLFATALIREVTNSNNFILQASTRCLRQVAGNTKPARIYIEEKNRKTLDAELQNNFGTNLMNLAYSAGDYEEEMIEIRKPNPPKIEIVKITREVVADSEHQDRDISLTKPDTTADEESDVIYKTIYEPNLEGKAELLTRTGEIEIVKIHDHHSDLFTAAKDIASRYHLKYLDIYNKLSALYPHNTIPKYHISKLCAQIDAQRKNYRMVEKQVTEVLAIIKIKDEFGNHVFKPNDEGVYCHTIRFKKGTKEGLMVHHDAMTKNHHDFGFHYSPYHFDVAPEKEFFTQMLVSVNERPEDIEDIYFTGGLTNTKQTDFYFEYKDANGKYRNYFPDFVIAKKNGDVVIVEIKQLGKEDDPEVRAKEKAVRVIEGINSDTFTYHILYTDTPIPIQEIKRVEDLVYKKA